MKYAPWVEIRALNPRFKGTDESNQETIPKIEPPKNSPVDDFPNARILPGMDPPFCHEC